ncbi:hypothetical protein [Rhizobium croatiense]|uniref:hypothetical protein n=1 Tax=Rhizobium croatiense TaxID=2867516 RepID=UPI001FECF13A|nr:hypothetical protein [Rhizobium croatiense]
MALNKRPGGAVLAAVIALLVGAGGGYAINEVIRSDRETDLEHEVARLKGEASHDASQVTRRLALRLRNPDGRCALRNANRARQCRV